MQCRVRERRNQSTSKVGAGDVRKERAMREKKVKEDKGQRGSRRTKKDMRMFYQKKEEKERGQGRKRKTSKGQRRGGGWIKKKRFGDRKKDVEAKTTNTGKQKKAS